MTRLVLLDSTPVGMLVHTREQVRTPVERWIGELASSSVVVLPEIILYEVRRELLRLDAAGSLRLLDALPSQFLYAPVTTSILLGASELWAQSRRRGRPTSGTRDLDIDVILAATAQDIVADSNDQAVVATRNIRHLSQFVDARLWDSIAP
ncbi:MAG: hypothetical protein WD557_05015 [Dehalococcoidia bacterium]